MKRWIIFFVLIACNSSSKGPSDLIPQENFVDILYEIELIDAIEIQNMGIDEQSDTLTLSNYKFLFDSIGISKEQFDRSFEYYKRDRNKMLEMTDTLLKRLGQKEEEISKKLRDQRWRSKKEND
ncbi:MAG: DUF4296 domain-containing protein [Bacteroidota bacterium]